MDALSGNRTHGEFIPQRLDRLIAERGPAPAEAALATELAMGVTRHRLTLDHLVAHVFHGRMSRLDRSLLPVLRVGVYQLVWLDRVPDFAAVDTAVEQAKRLAGRKAAGLVNALLRQILRRRLDPARTEPPHDPRRGVRIGPKRWREFDADLFADPGSDPAGYLSSATSHPAPVVRRWLDRYGWARTESICLAGSLRPPLVLRVNRRRIDVARLVQRLLDEGVTATADTSTGAVFVADAPPVRRISAVAEGLCQPQDATAQATVREAAPTPGQKVLDLCAGPGTKTLQLAEYMDDRGVILACDRSPEKIALVEETCRRMELGCVQTTPADALEAAAERVGPFDLALVDVPCSNSGVLARRPEARYRITVERIAGLSDTQGRLLALAARFVREGGRLVYATCSIEPEENEQVVQRFLTGSTGWELRHSKLTLPQVGQTLTDWRDGGFRAVMTRT